MNWFLASVIVKSDLRKSQLNRRLHLPQNEYLDRSKKIQINIVESEIFQQANLIACYLPIKNEVMTKSLMEFATNHSKIVAVPKIKDHMMVFQDYALLPWRTVESNVRMPFEFQDLGVSEAEKKKRVQECLELVDLDGFEKSFPYELSGGMKQRVGISRA